jgi:oligopeptide transport system substrate-binding protein
MNLPRWRNSFAFLLLLVLLVPILAACGGTAAVQPTAAPAAPAATEPAAAPEAATAETPTEAPTEEAATEATEAPAEEATEAPTEEAAAGAGDGEVSPAGNVLRVNFSEPENVDPQKSSFVDEIRFIMLNYLPLMTFDTELKPVPGAAESYELSEDGKTFTFKLRPDQMYSDGEPLTAANFEYAWKRLCDPNTAGEYASIAFPVVGCEEFFSAFDTGGLTVTDEAQLQALRDAVGAKALDESTFEITLKDPAPYFLNVAALWVGAPVREDLVEAGGETWWSDPANFIGNGPFQLVEWENQSRVRFERNENYVLSKPQFEAIEGPMSDESNVVFEAYKAGELDISGVAADPELKAQLNEVAGSCTFYIGFNNTKAPFDKMEVRQAFAQALDREAYVRDVLQGLGVPAQSFIPPGFPGHDADEKQWAFDSAAAKQLLETAGYDANQEVKFTFAASARGQARAEYLAAMLQNNLGVKVTIDPVDPTVYTSLFKRDEDTPQMFFLGWCADYPDPQNWVSLVFQTGGISSDRINYSNPQLDELTKQADQLPLDDPKRAELYTEAQKLLVKDAPVAFLYHEAGPFLVKPWVKGLNSTPLDYFPGIFDLGSIEVVTE